MVRYAEGKTQEDLDRIATSECDCDGAQRERNALYEESKARTAVGKLIQPGFPQAAAIMTEAVPFAAREMITGLRITLQNGAKAILKVSKSGTVDVKLSETIITTVEDAVEMEQVKDE
jgi:hypothetical protein